MGKGKFGVCVRGWGNLGPIGDFGPNFWKARKRGEEGKERIWEKVLKKRGRVLLGHSLTGRFLEGRAYWLKGNTLGEKKRVFIGSFFPRRN